MESRATLKFSRISPRKARLVARNVNGLPVEDALNILRFTPKKAADIIYKVVILRWPMLSRQAQMLTPCL